MLKAGLESFLRKPANVSGGKGTRICLCLVASCSRESQTRRGGGGCQTTIRLGLQHAARIALSVEFWRICSGQGACWSGIPLLSHSVISDAPPLSLRRCFVYVKAMRPVHRGGPSLCCSKDWADSFHIIQHSKDSFVYRSVLWPNGPLVIFVQYRGW